MRTLSFILLLSLSLYKVNALICYSCNSTTSNADCLMTNQTCLAAQDICMTKYEKYNGQEIVTVKQCARFATCKEEFDSGGNLVTCCITDLCNNATVATAKSSSGATTIHIHTALLLLPIGVLSLLSKYHR